MEKYYKIEKIKEINCRYLEELQKTSSYEPIWKKSDLTRFLKNKSNFSILCSLDEKIIGFCMCQKILDSLEICILVIQKNYRSQGLGKTIFEEIVKFCKKKRIKKILLEVKFENKAALSFYKSLNFKKVGIRKNYYNVSKKKSDALLMDLKL